MRTTPIHGQPPKWIIRTIAVNQPSPKSIVLTIPIGWPPSRSMCGPFQLVQYLKSVVRAVPIINIRQPSKSIVQAIPVKRQYLKSVVRATPIYRQLHKSDVWAILINKKYSESFVATIQINRNLRNWLPRQFQLVLIDSLSNQLPVPFKFVVRTDLYCIISQV